MESQVLVNILIGVAGGLGGWALNSLSRSITRLEDKMQDLPLQYVTREDYRADIADIKSMLNRIFDKLEGKADK